MRWPWIERARMLAEHIVLPSFTLAPGDFAYTPVDRLARPLDPETRLAIGLLSALLLVVLRTKGREIHRIVCAPTLRGVYRLICSGNARHRYAADAAGGHELVLSRIRQLAREEQRTTRVPSERSEWRYVDAKMGACLALEEGQRIVVISTVFHVLERCSNSPSPSARTAEDEASLFDCATANG